MSRTLMAMITLDCFNHAGGVGKTSVTLALAYEYARRGLRVLAVDLDPQASLTKVCGVRLGPADLHRTMHDTAVDGTPLPTPEQVHGFELIPSQLNLTLAESRMLGVVGSQLHLRRALRQVQNQYDVVLIDSPPSLGQLAILGALASDFLVVPLPTMDKGLEGLDGLRQAMAQYHKVHESLEIAMFIPTLYDRRISHHRDTLQHYQQHLRPLATEIPERSIWLDAWRARQPVGLYAAGSEADRAVQRLADEVAAATGLPSNGVARE